jgi:hypothetical protein
MLVFSFAVILLVSLLARRAKRGVF